MRLSEVDRCLQRYTETRLIKAAVIALIAIPMLLLCWQFLQDELGANPIEEITHQSGNWALMLLLMSLSVSPLRRQFGLHFLQSYRRILGLATFAYGCFHFSIYLFLDQFLDYAAIAEDILERPYITLGMTALMLMIPLALTSTKAMQQRLQQRWNQLHRLSYVIALLAVAHFWWLVKADIRQPLIFAAILLVLLGYRYLVWLRAK
ncbi:MAG: sulfoxide reductase heme-binding subunit YedZ [Gammaproteobacteria bacterium]|jgi:sulfoxide reductase heme-binding subunit YedZ|nr:sulfoxide reductase heme-binding subunit YedZ [Gammaproteobacteria bacterium]|tara:strand:- start:43523 stop:44140 length:618 start_codon:yes stop_codon:yes gene_type:complete